MRPHFLLRFILITAGVLAVAACGFETVGKEQTSFNNPEPMTGFEHTVTFDLQGTKMVIPYSYLARYTQDNAIKWLSNTPGQDAYSTNLIEISVYYKKPTKAGFSNHTTSKTKRTLSNFYAMVWTVWTILLSEKKRVI